MRRRRPDPNLTAWRLSLVAGLVVAVVEWALLEALRRTAIDVDESVEAVWTAGKRLAQNTHTSHLLIGTRDAGVGLLEELHRHRVLMVCPWTCVSAGLCAPSCRP